MYFIVDTNVPIVANRKTPQASLQCILVCVKKLQEIMTQQQHILVLDNKWLIITEYKYKLSPTGQPGVGDAFLKWVLTNQNNLSRCQLVEITPTEEKNFKEFPEDESLSGFDLSDRKFVAVALVHPEHPPILNASDSDWSHFEAALAAYGVRVEFICPELMPAKVEPPRNKKN
ncbi:hypothetical protein [Cylindrospermum sp. FACHB-282]|uniref:hypothetical protein n=1 Tax=Cylindrospermum sp. FACHB-282 TaxID=2692794 RepID=UPI001687CEFE|nr:hypothetical protein [Cylindrospermum sp. FACHB-282]MBD2386974.1 hypothetical protein [Cylindrospermum sp. FACHB-282]